MDLAKASLPTDFYHFDRFTICVYVPLGRDIKRQIKALPGFKLLRQFGKGTRSFLVFKDPDRPTFDGLVTALGTRPYHICKVELAHDAAFASLSEANHALDAIERTTYRKIVTRFRKICSSPKEDPRDPDLIGGKTLYYGSPVMQKPDGNRRRARSQLVIYVRRYRGHVVLREELRISHHHNIQRMTGIDTLADMPFFNLKSFLDDWIAENMAVGRFRFDQAASLFGPKPNPPSPEDLVVMRQMFPGCNPRKEYERMHREIGESILLHAWGDGTAEALSHYSQCKKQLQDYLKARPGRRSAHEKKVLNSKRETLIANNNV